MNNKPKNSLRIKHITATAMFCALAYVCTVLIHPPVQFLTLDVKDAVIVLCALLLGPIPGVIVAVVVPFLEFITISDTGIYGLIMNVLSSVTFSLLTSLIYRYKKSMMGAIVGLLSGVFGVTAVMLIANLLITPYYMHVPREAVISLILPLLLPFNLLKAVLNAALVLLLYKPLSKALKKIGFVGLRDSTQRNASGGKWRSLIISLVAIVVIAASLIIIFSVLPNNG